MEYDHDSLKKLLQKYESKIIRDAFQKLGSSYKVARVLKISQSQASYKIRKYLSAEE